MKAHLTYVGKGVLHVDDDYSAVKLQKLKTGERYTVNITLINDYLFHKKLMSLLRFAFNFTCTEYDFYRNTTEQFDIFRKMVTIKAGYFNQVFDLDGQSFTLEAKSLNFEIMPAFERYQYFEAVLNYLWGSSLFMDADNKTLLTLKGFDTWIKKNVETKNVQ